MTLRTAAIVIVTVVFDVAPYILSAAADRCGQFCCVLRAGRWEFFSLKRGAADSPNLFLNVFCTAHFNIIIQ